METLASEEDTRRLIQLYSNSLDDIMSLLCKMCYLGIGSDTVTARVLDANTTRISRKIVEDLCGLKSLISIMSLTLEADGIDSLEADMQATETLATVTGSSLSLAVGKRRKLERSTGQ